MRLIEVNPDAFIMNKNARVLDVAVAGAKIQRPCLVEVDGDAGRGKTIAATVKAAREDDVFLRVLAIDGKSGLDILQRTCRELGVIAPPGRRTRCFSEIVDRLRGTDRTVYLDEAQRLGPSLLDLVLDLSDQTGCVFVLIGEPELRGLMQMNKRCWSRCYQHVEFEPLSMADVIIYTREAAGLNLSADVAAIFHRASNGDFRLLKRSVYAAIQLANSRQTIEIDAELAQIAAGVSLTGAKGNGKAMRLAARGAVKAAV